jgi:Uma2 family endonuclease
MSELLTAEQLSSVLEKQIAEIAPEWLAEQPNLRERLTEALAIDPDQLLLPTMTYEEFLLWADEDVHAEWVEGKVLLMTPASSRHQRISMFLGTLLNLYVSSHDLGEVFDAPFQMRLHQPPRGREPDILFVAKEHLGQITEQFLDGPADMVVEIISPESTRRDRRAKFSEYEASGIREYWLIDPQREYAEFYQLDIQGHYTLAMDGHSGQYTSLIIPGLTIDLTWLWQDPPPHVLKIMQF